MLQSLRDIAPILIVIAFFQLVILRQPFPDLAETLGGVFLDRRLGTTPWLTLLGIALGMSAGLTSVLRTALALDRKRRRGGNGEGESK